MCALRLLLASSLFAVSLLANPASATSFSTDQSDLWYIPAESGWGIQLVGSTRGASEKRALRRTPWRSAWRPRAKARDGGSRNATCFLGSARRRASPAWSIGAFGETTLMVERHRLRVAPRICIHHCRSCGGAVKSIFMVTVPGSEREGAQPKRRASPIMR